MEGATVTLLGFLSSLAWTATAVLFVARLHSWADRWLTVHERLHAPSLLAESEAEAMPPDLMGYVHAISTGNAEMDGIMQEQTLSVLHEQYAALGSWGKVRAWSATNLSTDTRADGWGNS